MKHARLGAASAILKTGNYPVGHDIKKPIILSGTVSAFSGNGRKLGYPTANISTSTDLADGIYFGFANLGKHKYCPALIFIGTPTTVGDKDRRVEAHLFGIKDVDYYGLELKLQVAHYHRPSQTFDSVDELTVHMKNDETVARKWFGEHTPKTPRLET